MFLCTLSAISSISLISEGFYEIHNEELFLAENYDNSIMREISNIIRFMDVRNWVENRIRVPRIHERMQKDSYGFQKWRTYDGDDYLDLVTYLICVSALSVIGAVFVLKAEPRSKDVSYELLYEYTVDAIGPNLPIVEKTLQQTTALQKDDEDVNVIRQGVSQETFVKKILITSLYGRLQTHNILADKDNITLITRMDNVIKGKSKRSGKNKPTERKNQRDGKAISPFDLTKIYKVSSNIPEEHLWVLEDPMFFLTQVIKNPNRKLVKNYKLALKYVSGYLDERLLGLLGVALREFIPPQTLKSLGKARPSHTEIQKPIDVCRSLAYALMVEEFPLLATLMISEKEFNSGINLSDNILQQKLKGELGNYTHATVSPNINIIASIVREDYFCRLPKANGGGPVIMPTSIRGEITNMLNHFNILSKGEFLRNNPDRVRIDDRIEYEDCPTFEDYYGANSKYKGGLTV